MRVPKPFNFGVGVGISPRKPGRHPHLPIELPTVTTTARNPSKNSQDDNANEDDVGLVDDSTEAIQVMVNFQQ